MSPIGRVFIVLNLLLAGVFLCYSGFYLQRLDSFRAKYDDEVAAHQKDNADRDGRIAALDSATQEQANDLRADKQKIVDLETALKNKDEENTDLKGRYDDLQSNVAKMTGSMSTVADRLDKQGQRVVELEGKFAAAEKERNAALAARDDMQDQLAAARAEGGRKDARVAALMHELTSKSEALADAELKIQVMLTEEPGLADVAMGTMPDRRGTVLDVKPELGTVTLSIGEDQKVQKGWTFAAHDNKKYKGQLIVIDVMPKAAIARIVKSVPGTTIRKGDLVATHLR